jgi:RNA binding exosome subunit
MKSYSLLREVDRAKKILVEVESSGKQNWLLQVDKQDLEMQIMHVTNGTDIETGFKTSWSDKGVVKLLKQ